MANSYIFYSTAKLLSLIKPNKGINTISDLVIKAEEEITRHSYAEIMDNAIDRIKVMKESIDKGMTVKSSRSGMVKDEASKMISMLGNDKMLMNPLLIKAIAWALGTMASNSVMGRIIAAPTAGSAGVLPGCLLAYQDEFKLSDEQVARGLLTAAGVGMIIGHASTFSASKAGCQAEIGNASAMAAAAISELRGMSPEKCMNAAALSLKNMLGLACDPIGGLVEVPCVKRNAFGVSNAITASDLSYAGVESVVPFDEVLEAMNNIAKHMAPAIRETSSGGLAITRTALKIDEKLIKIGR